jgi:hypothetical protein
LGFCQQIYNNLAFVRCEIIDFVDMQAIAFVSMATEVAHGDMVGAAHSLFLGPWVGDEDALCNWRLSGAGEFDETFGFHLIYFFLRHLQGVGVLMGTLWCFGVVRSHKFVGGGILGITLVGSLFDGSRIVGCSIRDSIREELHDGGHIMVVPQV